MHAPRIRPQNKLFVTPAMAAHPTLAGEQIVGGQVVARRRRRRTAPGQPLPLPAISRLPKPPPLPPQALTPGAWLFVCAAPAIAAVIFAGLLA